MTKMTKTEGICHSQNKKFKIQNKNSNHKNHKKPGKCDFKNKQGCRMTRMTKMKGFY